MKRLTLITISFMASWSASAADLGVDGQVWPISEPDLILAIKAELQSAEADGRLAAFNNQVANDAKQGLLDPPSLGLPRAWREKTWAYDPSIVVHEDIRSHKGDLIAARGTRVNPLEQIGLRAPLLFVDGNDPDQMEWVAEQTGKIILTGGSPKYLMDEFDRRMFFDQRAILVTKFGITALPARVSQDDLMLKIEEIYIETKEGSDG